MDDAVAAIIADVRARGDAALIELTEKFDRLACRPQGCASPREEIDALVAQVPEADRAALELAAERIRAYHARQMPAGRELDRRRAAPRWAGAGAGLGGGALRARGAGLLSVLGADERDPGQGRRGGPAGDHGAHPRRVANPLVLLAARLAGVDEIYRMGGAQAIAALAYGTETVAPVDKITGPGNAFVAAAKRRSSAGWGST